ncbi:flavodoxin family protein [Streptomyces sp. NPDC051561]|uniref:flavodoxin family protein n=1 Tax=Streptomyces sp. NPDC051561 TaxID=3365658 RepID=UPI0037BBD736
MTKKPRVAIAYYSGYGHTTVLAKAVEAGAVEAGAEVTLIRVDTITEEQWQVLDAADAIVFGSPTYMGSAAGKFHVFAESTSKRWVAEVWSDKVGAGFTNAACKAGDKHSTLGYFATLGAQHQMNWVNLGLLPGWHTSTESENDLNRLGYFNGAAASTPADLPPEAVSKADIATAEYLGERVARHTAVVLAGREALAATAA